jgi:hypothetical protein
MYLVSFSLQARIIPSTRAFLQAPLALPVSLLHTEQLLKKSAICFHIFSN